MNWLLLLLGVGAAGAVTYYYLSSPASAEPMPPPPATKPSVYDALVRRMEVPQPSQFPPQPASPAQQPVFPWASVPSWGQAQPGDYDLWSDLGAVPSPQKQQQQMQGGEVKPGYDFWSELPNATPQNFSQAQIDQMNREGWIANTKQIASKSGPASYMAP